DGSPAEVARADGDTVRKAAIGQIMGGACELAPGSAGQILALCEGVETGLAILAARPMWGVWACISAGGLRGVDLPDDLHTRCAGVVVCADLDASGTGQTAAKDAARRVATICPGLPVGVAVPTSDVAPSLIDPAGRPCGKSVDWLDCYVADAAACRRALAQAEISARPTVDLIDEATDAPQGPLMPARDADRARRHIVDTYSGEPWERRNRGARVLYVDSAWYRWDGRRHVRMDEDTEVRAEVRRWSSPFDRVRFGRGEDKAPKYYRYNPSLSELKSIVEAVREEVCVNRGDDMVGRFWLRPLFDARGEPDWGRRPWERIVRPHEYGEGVPDPAQLVALRDGMFDAAQWRATGEWRTYPHTELLYNTVASDLALPEGAAELWDELHGDEHRIERLREYAWSRCPLYRQVLRDIFGDLDDVAFGEVSRELHKLWGYYLTPDIAIHRGNIAFFIGPPGSGKSTLMAVARALVGESNVVPSRLDKLTDGAHIVEWVGKLVAQCPDADLSGRADARLITEILKMATGGDPISARRLYQDEMWFRLHARVMIACNEAPQLADATGAFSRRSLFFDLRRVIQRPDPDLVEGRKRLLQPDELSGVLLLALCGLYDLGTDGGFAQPAQGRDAAEAFAALTGEVRGYAELCVRVSNREEDWVSWSRLYEVFGAYRRVELARTGDAARRERVIEQLRVVLQTRGWTRYDAVKRSVGSRAWPQTGWSGLALTPDATSIELADRHDDTGGAGGTYDDRLPM
ncbi:MAG: DUF5906 domain-containing protein, partial [Leptolyngbyaceae bacterium]|nr:DUF5906 domain-containing protein [Leptolyngbyaceae bacterium]